MLSQYFFQSTKYTNVVWYHIWSRQTQSIWKHTEIYKRGKTFFLCLFFNGATGVQIHSFILPHRSASPRSRDSKVKREKDIKTEEEEDQKKKEKVGVVQFHIIPLIWLFFSIHSLLLLSRSNLYLWKNFLQKRRQKRKQRPRWECFWGQTLLPFLKLGNHSHIYHCFSAQIPVKGRARGWGSEAQGAGDGGEAEVEWWGEEEEENVSGYW